MTFTPLLLLQVLWGLWLLQAGGAYLLARQYRNRVSKQKSGWTTDHRPSAAVIVPVKGAANLADNPVASDTLRKQIAALRQQDYPHYRLMCVVESTDDPACPILREQASVEVIVAGRAERGGQKVHNQLAALEHLRDDDEVVVFADADAVVGTDWLERLIGPLNKRPRRIGVSTTYRWMVPVSGKSIRLGTALVCGVNNGIAMLTGPARRNFAWGGSMAMKRETLEQLDLRRWWDGAISDDFQVNRMIRAAGMKVSCVFRCMPLSPIDLTLREAARFGRRQYLITRTHALWLWWRVLPLVWLPPIAAGAALTWAAVGSGLDRWQGLVAWLGVIGLDWLRVAERRTVARRIFGDRLPAEAHRLQRVEPFIAPLLALGHAVIHLLSAAGRCIEWAGIRYEIRGRNDVCIIRRD